MGSSRGDRVEWAEARGFALWRRMLEWQRRGDEALRSLELTHTRFLVLASAAAAESDAQDAVSQRAIADRARMAPAAASRAIRALELGGSLSRGPDGLDDRQMRVILTERGQETLREAAVQEAQCGKVLPQSLGPELRLSLAKVRHPLANLRLTQIGRATAVKLREIADAAYVRLLRTIGVASEVEIIHHLPA